MWNWGLRYMFYNFLYYNLLNKKLDIKSIYLYSFASGCEKGFYGENCTKCDLPENCETCDVTNGSCYRCHRNFTGPNCLQGILCNTRRLLNNNKYSCFLDKYKYKIFIIFINFHNFHFDYIWTKQWNVLRYHLWS